MSKKDVKRAVRDELFSLTKYLERKIAKANAKDRVRQSKGKK